MAFLLEQPLTLWRIAHRQYPLWDGMGAERYGGRWNSAGRRAIYTCEHYSLSILEVLANLGSGSIPSVFVRGALTVPTGCTAERVDVAQVKDWDHPTDHRKARAFGDAWLQERRSLLLFVPSVVVEGMEWNVVLNPLHPEFAALALPSPEAIRWDGGLLR